MTRPDEVFTRVLAVVAILSALAATAAALVMKDECEARGGRLVRGAFVLECGEAR